MSNYTISSSDEELLRALTMVDDLKKEVFSNCSSDMRYKSPFESGNSEIVISVSDSTSDSVFLKSSDSVTEVYESFKLDPEFQVVSQNIEELYTMNDLFLERKSNLEAETKSSIENAMAPSQEIISVDILRKRLSNINLVLKHMHTIIDQMSKIKQILQDAPLKSSIKVSPSCQKDTIQFFEATQDIFKKILEKETDFEDPNNKAKIIPMNKSMLHSKLQSITAVLARRIDKLTDFRRHLLTEDSESGVESGLGESQNPNMPTDQASLDSGCNSLKNFD